MTNRPVDSPPMQRRFTPGASTPTAGVTFCPDWLPTSSCQPWHCRRRRIITRESGDGRGGNTRRR
ncbi:hypothetical protein LINGRAHAP2_LOCUS12892 [Linum grandiflorum]